MIKTGADTWLVCNFQWAGYAISGFETALPGTVFWANNGDHDMGFAQKEAKGYPQLGKVYNGTLWKVEIKRV